MTATTPTDRNEFLGYLTAADVPGAVAMARRLLDAGASVEQVLTGLIAPVQARLGELWQENRISIADEHAASHISDLVVSVLSATAAPPPSHPTDLVVTCADGEWHTLPARLITESLRLRGWRTTFLGPSLPAAHLTTYLQQHPADAVLISITLPVRLPQARRAVLAAQQAGVPTIVGGRGFGTSARWAWQLGADAWAPDPAAAAAVLENWPPDRWPLDGPADVDLDLDRLADDREYARLRQHTADLVSGALDALRTAFPPLRDYTPAQLDATRDDLGHILDFLAAAVYVDDRTLFQDFVGWLVTVLVTRRVPAVSIRPVLAYLHTALPDRPRTRRIIATGQAKLAEALNVAEVE